MTGVWIICGAAGLLAIGVFLLAVLSAAETLEDPLAQIERREIEEGRRR